MKKRIFIVALFGSVATTLIDCAQAKRMRFRFGRGIVGGARNSYTPDTLTVDQLRECLSLQEDLEAANRQSQFGSSDIQSLGSKLKGKKREIEFRQITLDRYSQYEVDSYNAEIEEFERLRSRYNNLVEEANAVTANNNAKVDHFNMRCANKRYYEDDLKEAEGG